MRVTDLTKQNTVLRNIQSSAEHMQGLQGDISSGKRIAKLSDDPVGATQAQDFRTRISFMNTLKSNIQDNFVWLDRTEAEIAEVGIMLRRTKTLILSQANASGDDATRRVTAEELEAIINGMVNAGNARIVGNFGDPLAGGNIPLQALHLFRRDLNIAQDGVLFC